MNNDLKTELMEAYKAWELHQRTTQNEFAMGEALWERYVFCRNRWSLAHVPSSPYGRQQN
jgi:hypothetical protein